LPFFPTNCTFRIIYYNSKQKFKNKNKLKIESKVKEKQKNKNLSIYLSRKLSVKRRGKNPPSPLCEKLPAG